MRCFSYITALICLPLSAIILLGLVSGCTGYDPTRPSDVPLDPAVAYWYENPRPRLTGESAVSQPVRTTLPVAPVYNRPSATQSLGIDPDFSVLPRSERLRLDAQAISEELKRGR